jgi:hypothetical protein
MPIDVSGMPPAEASQVRMFETMTDAMPTEALQLLVEILQQKIKERRVK